MTDNESRSLDLLGVKPVADAINVVTKGTVAGASAFLSRICLPVAEEIGLLFQDRVRAYRSQNAVAIANKAEQKLEVPGGDSLHGHPRLVGLILEQGSWVEVSEVQEMWAGLLASSCSEDGRDDSNLMFVDLLSRLSTSQARLLNYACRAAGAQAAPNGLLIASSYVVMTLDDLKDVSGLTDLHRLDRELDHLRDLGLMHPKSGFGVQSAETMASVTPSPLALQMFARLNGHRGDPLTFFESHEPADYNPYDGVDPSA
jgi:hypothetical protein